MVRGPGTPQTKIRLTKVLRQSENRIRKQYIAISYEILHELINIICDSIIVQSFHYVHNASSGKAFDSVALKSCCPDSNGMLSESSGESQTSPRRVPE